MKAASGRSNGSNGKQCGFCNIVKFPRETFLTFLLLVSIKWIDT